jgi:hypothetical protein
MRRAVDIGIFLPVEGGEAIDYSIRFLRGSGIVQPHQRSPIHRLLQDRKVALDDVRIE